MNIFTNLFKSYSNMKLLSVILALYISITITFGQVNLTGVEVKIQNETGINTENLEFAPVYYRDGIVFITSQYDQGKYAITDTRIGHNILSIFKATRGSDADGRLQNPEPLAKELLSTVHEVGATFNSSAEIIYFTRNDLKNTSNSSGNYLKKLNIYSAQYVNEKWDNIKEVPFNEDGYNTIHPTISPDMDELYFSSDRPGGYGSFDLYVVRKVGGEWGSPINLGPQVNTPKAEVFPFIHADGTLYFSSNGHGGLGGLDLFYTNKSREVWKRPVSLGEPFNSSKDDLGFIIDLDKKNGYFSSDRSGGKGGDDIYSFKLDGAKAGANEIIATVIDAGTNELIAGAKISYINLNEVIMLPPSQDSQNIGIQTTTKEGEITITLSMKDKGTNGVTDEEGKYVFNLADGQYAILVSNDGYLPNQVTFNVPSSLTSKGFLIPLEKAVDCFPLSGKISTANAALLPVGVTVMIKDVKTQEVFKVLTDGNGDYKYCLKCGREYEIYGMKDGVSSGVTTISTINQPCNERLAVSKNITMPTGGGSSFGGVATNGEEVVGAPITVGTIIQLPNIYYNFNDTELRTDALSDLDLIVKMLNTYPEMVIEIASHTDSRGSETYNQELSEKRSKKAVEYVVAQGISSDRVAPVGYGETKPRNRCINGSKCPESQHQENRRTEVIIKKLGDSFSAVQQDPEAIKKLSEYVAEGSPNSEATNSSEKIVNRAPESDNEKPFYVIAGTFKNTENANSRMSELKKLGFTNTEVIQFSYPSYNAVCVDKLNSEEEARKLVSSLGDNGVESYVRRMD